MNNEMECPRCHKKMLRVDTYRFLLWKNFYLECDHCRLLKKISRKEIAESIIREAKI